MEASSEVINDDDDEQEEESSEHKSSRGSKKRKTTASKSSTSTRSTKRKKNEPKTTTGATRKSSTKTTTAHAPAEALPPVWHEFQISLDDLNGIPNSTYRDNEINAIAGMIFICLPMILLLVHSYRLAMSFVESLQQGELDTFRRLLLKADEVKRLSGTRRLTSRDFQQLVLTLSWEEVIMYAFFPSCRLRPLFVYSLIVALLLGIWFCSAARIQTSPGRYHAAPNASSRSTPKSH